MDVGVNLRPKYDNMKKSAQKSTVLHKKFFFLHDVLYHCQTLIIFFSKIQTQL